MTKDQLTQAGYNPKDVPDLVWASLEINQAALNEIGQIIGLGFINPVMAEGQIFAAGELRCFTAHPLEPLAIIKGVRRLKGAYDNLSHNTRKIGEDT